MSLGAAVGRERARGGTPRREAVVFVLRRGPRVLVVRRGPATVLAGWWAPPSGRIEPGEVPEETVVREAREELGVEVVPAGEVWTCPTDDGSYLLRWWLADLDDGAELRPDPAEVAEARWVTPDEYLSLAPRFAGDEAFFRDVLPELG